MSFLSAYFSEFGSKETWFFPSVAKGTYSVAISLSFRSLSLIAWGSRPVRTAVMGLGGRSMRALTPSACHSSESNQRRLPQSSYFCPSCHAFPGYLLWEDNNFNDKHHSSTFLSYVSRRSLFQPGIEADWPKTCLTRSVMALLARRWVREINLAWCLFTSALY